MKIAIDYQGRTYGRFLEFVCNTLLGITTGTPFYRGWVGYVDINGKNYAGDKVFEANQHFFLPKDIEAEKVISIQFDINDLLPVQQTNLLVEIPYGYDMIPIEINTYNRFNEIKGYRDILQNLSDNFFKNQIKESYNAVRDPSWPDVTTIAEFEKLPDIIKQECIEQHKLELLEFSADYPDCPRQILREFFQIGFSKPEQHGLILSQKKMQYQEDKQVYIFPFRCFYNKHDFLEQIEKITEWAGIPHNYQQKIELLHDEFLQKEPYRNSKAKCDMIINIIQTGIRESWPKYEITESSAVSELDVVEEAYINAALGQDWFQ